jgi:hypothetical protein
MCRMGIIKNSDLWIRDAGQPVPWPEAQAAAVDQPGEEGVTGGDAGQPSKRVAGRAPLSSILIPSTGLDPGLRRGTAGSPLSRG